VIRILVGDCRETLKTLEPESVHCVITSPPYWGLRDYGADGQLGLEATPEEHVAVMVDVFREVRRVLREDGTCWVNYGDCYAGGHSGRNDSGREIQRADGSVGKTTQKHDGKTRSRPLAGLKPKDLVGMPWRVAFALQADGWWLRSDIIWHKPNPMPESVTDRPTKAHEYVFLLTKAARYYYDADAVREANQDKAPLTRFAKNPGALGGHKARRLDDANVDPGRTITSGEQLHELHSSGRNLRTVWTIPTHAFPGAHFATFPPKLVEPCIKAGCPKGGVVLDPFGGAGTVGLVADRLQRDAVLVELNEEYADMARKRIAGDCPMFTQVEMVGDA
jgi:DNA modification methylase